jgi:hypothetical protein
MEIPKISEAEAREAHKPRRKLPPGPYRGTVVELTQGVSPNGNKTARVVTAISGPDGTEYRLVDVLSATKLGTLKLLRFARACSCEDRIEASMCLGRELIATVATEPRKGSFPARSVIIDYSPVTDANVTPLRSAL